MARTEIVACVILGLCVSACIAGCTREHPITVGSKNFTEQVVLGEIVAQHLEHRLGRPVSRKLNLGGTMLAHQALLRGEIDVYPEYTGTALTAILKLPPAHDPVAGITLVRGEYQARFGLQWMPPLGFNNTFAMVVRGDDARKHKISTLSDAARYAPGWTLGVGYEFQQRPDGLAGLQKTYHLPIHGTPKTMIRTVTVGCSRRSPLGWPVASTPQQRPLLRRTIWRARFGVRKQPTESTRKTYWVESAIKTGPSGMPHTCR